MGLMKNGRMHYWDQGELKEIPRAVPGYVREVVAALGDDPTEAQLWSYWYKRRTDEAGDDPVRIAKVMAELEQAYPYTVHNLVDSATDRHYGKEYRFRDGSVITVRFDQPGELHASKGRIRPAGIIHLD